MREILFRGKRDDTGEWVEGHLIWYEDGRVRITPRHTEIFSNESGESIYHIAYEVIPETIGQYTGLNDNTKWEQLTEKEQSDWFKNHTVEEWNGKKIFEGDIVQSVYFKHKAVVIFDEYSRFVAKLTDNSTYLIARECDNVKVIGNIHDNPELLGGEE